MKKIMVSMLVVLMMWMAFGSFVYAEETAEAVEVVELQEDAEEVRVRDAAPDEDEGEPYLMIGIKCGNETKIGNTDGFIDVSVYTGDYFFGNIGTVDVTPYSTYEVVVIFCHGDKTKKQNVTYDADTFIVSRDSSVVECDDLNKAIHTYAANSQVTEIYAEYTYNGETYMDMCPVKVVKPNIQNQIIDQNINSKEALEYAALCNVAYTDFSEEQYGKTIGQMLEENVSLYQKNDSLSKDGFGATMATVYSSAIGKFQLRNQCELSYLYDFSDTDGKNVKVSMKLCATLFYNPYKENFVIAYSSTMPNELKQLGIDISNSSEYAWLYNNYAGFEAARILYNKLNITDGSVLIGHSLGGYLAEYVSTYYDVEAYTYNAPSTFRILVQSMTTTVKEGRNHFQDIFKGITKKRYHFTNERDKVGKIDFNSGASIYISVEDQSYVNGVNNNVDDKFAYHDIRQMIDYTMNSNKITLKLKNVKRYITEDNTSTFITNSRERYCFGSPEGDLLILRSLGHGSVFGGDGDDIIWIGEKYLPNIPEDRLQLLCDFINVYLGEQADGVLDKGLDWIGKKNGYLKSAVSVLKKIKIAGGFWDNFYYACTFLTVLGASDFIYPGNGNDFIHSYRITGNQYYFYKKGDGIDTIVDDHGNDSVMIYGIEDIKVEYNAGVKADYPYYLIYEKGADSPFMVLSAYGTGLYTINLDGKTNCICPKISGKTRMINIEGPVDVHIFDTDSNLVYTLEDKIVSEEVSNFGYAFVNEENGQYNKTVVLLHDNYDIMITGNDNGTMKYTYLDFDAEGNTIYRIIDDVPVQKDAIYERSADLSDLILYGDLNADGEYDYKSKYIAPMSMALNYTSGKLGYPEIMTLSLDYTNIELGYLDTMTLEAEILPANAPQNVSWNSSNPEVVTIDENGVIQVVGVGEAVITATSFFESTIAAECMITVPDTSISIQNASVIGINNYYEYTGERIIPEIEVTYNGTELKYGTDYIVDYENNLQPGNASVTLSGMGYFSGESVFTFSIGSITVDAVVTKAANDCKASGAETEYEIARWLHDWLVNRADYDYSLTEYYADGVLLKGSGVCQSYALAYQLLLNKMNIENMVLMAPEMDHAWNLVKIDGSWTHIDCTWDDPNWGGYENRDYFGLSDEQMKEDHVWDYSSYPEAFAIKREVKLEDLPQPYTLPEPIAGIDFTFMDSSGTVVTREDYPADNVLLIYGNATNRYMNRFINAIKPWKTILEEQNVEVLVVLNDRAEVIEKEAKIPFRCVYEADLGYELSEFMGRAGIDGWISYPIVVLQNAAGYASYYTTGLVYEPEGVLSTAMQELPGMESLSINPVFFYTDEATLESCIKTALEKKYKTLKLLNWNNTTANEEDYALACELVEKYALQYGSKVVSSTYMGALLIFKLEPDAYVEEKLPEAFELLEPIAGIDFTYVNATDEILTHEDYTAGNVLLVYGDLQSTYTKDFVDRIIPWKDVLEAHNVEVFIVQDGCPDGSESTDGIPFNCVYDIDIDERNKFLSRIGLGGMSLTSIDPVVVLQNTNGYVSYYSYDFVEEPARVIATIIQELPGSGTLNTAPVLLYADETTLEACIKDALEKKYTTIKLYNLNNHTFNETEYTLAVDWVKQYAIQYKARVLSSDSEGALFIFEVEPDAYLEEKLPEPYELMDPIAGIGFTCVDAAGTVITRNDYSSDNVVLIYGTINDTYTVSFIESIVPWKDVLTEHHVEVLVVLEDKEQVSEYKDKIPFTCVYDVDLDETYQFMTRTGLANGYTYPLVLLQNPGGYVSYYSQGISVDADRMAATAILELPESETLNVDPVLFYTDDATLEACIKDALEKKYTSVKLRNLNKETLDQNDANLAVSLFNEYAEQYGSNWLSYRLFGAMMIFEVETDVYEEDKLPEPFALTGPTAGIDFTYVTASGKILTRNDYGTNNFMLIYGLPNEAYTMSLINNLTAWKSVLEENQVEVILVCSDRTLVNEYADEIPFECVFDVDIDEKNKFLNANGMADGYMYPLVLLQNANGYVSYYSEDYVEEPERLVATAIQTLPGSGNLNVDPVLFYTDETSLENCIRDAIEKKYANVKLYNLNNESFNEAEYLLAEGWVQEYCAEYGSRLLGAKYIGALMIFSIGSDAYAEDKLPEPFELITPIEGLDFTYVNASGTVLNREDYGSDNLLLIYGNSSEGNTTALIDSLAPWKYVLAENQVEVLVILNERNQVSSYAEQIPFECAYDVDLYEHSEFVTRIGTLNMYEYPLVVLQNENGYVSYYSDGFVSEPDRLVATAIQTLPGNGTVSADPVLFYTDNVTLENCIKEALEKKYEIVKLYNLNNEGFNEADYASATAWIQEYSVQYGSSVLSSNHAGALMIFEVRSDAYVEDKLPEPFALIKPFAGIDFTCVNASGTVLTREDYTSDNVLLIYGDSASTNLHALMNHLTPWRHVLSDHNVEVLVILNSRAQVTEYANEIPFECAYDVDVQETSKLIDTLGLSEGYKYPLVVLQNANGYVSYYSQDYVEEPDRLVATAIQTLPQSDAVSVDPVLFYTNETTLETCIKEALEKKYETVKLYNLNNQSFNETEYKLAAELMQKYSSQYGSVITNSGYLGAMLIFIMQPDAYVEENLPEPFTLTGPTAGINFTYVDADGTVLTRKNYAGKNLMLIYGEPGNVNITSLLNSMEPWRYVLAENNVQVLVISKDREQVSTYAGSNLYDCVLDVDYDEKNKFLTRIGMTNNYTYPLVVLQNANGYVSYYSQGYVGEPERLIATAIQTLPGSGTMSADPVLFYTNETTLETCIKEALEKKYATVKLYNLNNNDLNQAEYTLATEMIQEYSVQYGSRVSSYGYIGALLIFTVESDSYIKENLPEPFTLITPVAGLDFTYLSDSGTLLNREDYGADNLLLIYGDSYDVTDLINSMIPWKYVLAENNVEVIVVMDDREQASIYANEIPFSCVYDIDLEEREKFLERIGMTDGYLAPLVVLQNANGYVSYYSDGYVEEPERLIATAMQTLPGSGTIHAAPILFYTNEVTLENCIKEALENKYTLVKLRNLSKDTLESTDADLAVSLFEQYAMQYGSRLLSYRSVGPMMIFDVEPDAYVKEKLPEPFVLTTPVAGTNFTYVNASGTALTRKDYETSKLLLIYGHPSNYYTTALVEGLVPWKKVLTENNVEVIVILEDRSQVSEYSKTSPFECVYDVDYIETSGFMSRIGMESGYNYPLIALQNANGFVSYYSDGYVEEPERLIATAIQTLPGTGSLNADPVLFYTNDASLESCVKEALEKKYATVKLYNPNNNSFNEAEYNKAIDWMYEYSIAYGSRVINFGYWGAMIIIDIETDAYVEEKLPEPFELKEPVEGIDFTYVNQSGEVFTREDYPDENILMIYGTPYDSNSKSLMDSLKAWKNVIEEHQVQVFVVFEGSDLVNEYANDLPFECVYDADFALECYELLERIEKTNGYTYPLLVLQNADGYVSYYSDGYVEEPERLVAAMIKELPETDKLEVQDPILFYTDNASLEEAVKTALENRYDTIRLRNLNKESFDQNDFDLAAELLSQYGPQHGLDCVWSGYRYSLMIFGMEDTQVQLRIVEQPESITGVNGASAVFKIRAEGSGLKYQWQLSTDGGKKWYNASSTSTEYATVLKTDRDGRMVRCIVTDEYGQSVTSEAAVMRIAEVIKITKQPQNFSGANGASVVFKIEAEGSGLKYQWQLSTDGGKKWYNASSISTEYATVLKTDRDGRMVRCIVSDQNGQSVTSEAAVMRIAEVIKITKQPQNFSGANGASVIFKIEAEGTGLTYQWQFSTNGGTKWYNASATSTEYATVLKTDRDGRMVRCIVTNQGGQSVTSETAVMRIAE